MSRKTRIEQLERKYSTAGKVIVFVEDEIENEFTVDGKTVTREEYERLRAEYADNPNTFCIQIVEVDENTIRKVTSA